MHSVASFIFALLLLVGICTAPALAQRRAQPLSSPEEQSLKPKESFKECEACPTMVVVPAGSFTRGSPESEVGRGAEEGPRHRVTFRSSFAVGRFAVTFEEWDACLGDDGCNGYKPADEGWGRGRMPVINVSWEDAKAYAGWLSKKTRQAYRLLTEAEREYVTRAGTTTPFWWGERLSTDQANFYFDPERYGLTVKGENRGKTVAADSFAPNPWGFYQLHGNVQEWVEDCWNSSYQGARNDGSAWTGGDCSRRVLRGGAWYAEPLLLRSASRNNAAPDMRESGIGLRVARTPAIAR